MFLDGLILRSVSLVCFSAGVLCKRGKVHIPGLWVSTVSKGEMVSDCSPVEISTRGLCCVERVRVDRSGV